MRRTGGAVEVIPEVTRFIGLWAWHKVVGHPVKDIVQPTSVYPKRYCGTCGAYDI